MAKFILFASGILSARYDSDIHGENIPEDAIEVSNEVFFQTINEQDGEWRLADNQIVKVPFATPTIAELIANKIANINSEFELAMQQITTGYPPNEIASWSKQEAEAREFTIGSVTAQTPFLDALAAARGLTKIDLASRIIAKADLFATVSGQLIGKRQGLEDALDALPEDATAEDVEAINWS